MLQNGENDNDEAFFNKLKKKHLPFVFINADKQRDVYLDSLDEE